MVRENHPGRQAVQPQAGGDTELRRWKTKPSTDNQRSHGRVYTYRHEAYSENSPTARETETGYPKNQLGRRNCTCEQQQCEKVY